MELDGDERVLDVHRETDVSETESEVVSRAGSDPAVTGDHRTLLNLTAQERTSHVSSYSSQVQTDIQPYMRKILALWMFQVHK